jgi:hypothetical protein
MARKASTRLQQEFLEAYRAVDPRERSAVEGVFISHFVSVMRSIRSPVHASHGHEIDLLVDEMVRAPPERQASTMIGLMTRLYQLNDM